MISGELLIFPFMTFLILAFLGLGILVFALWVWMLVDAVQRNFKNDTEKIVWILIIVLASWVGAIVYYFVIKAKNSRGVSKK